MRNTGSIVFRSGAVCLACFAAAVVGCAPPYEPTWLPDSSGFIYPARDGRIVKFDVESKTHETLLRIEAGAPTSVAVSPAGDRIAITTSTSKTPLTVRVYDLAENRLLSTIVDPDSILTRSANDFPVLTGASWSPNSRYLAVTFRLDPLFPSWALVDLEEKSLRDMRDFGSTFVISSELALSPFADDGSGMLLMEHVSRPNPDRIYELSDLQFMTWDGKRSHFEVDEGTQRLVDGTLRARREPLDQRRRYVVLDAAWKDGTATVTLHNMHLVIDTCKLTITHQAPDEATAALGSELLEESVSHSLPLGDGGFRVERVAKPTYDYKLRIVNRKREDFRVIGYSQHSAVDDGYLNWTSIVRSPNRKWAVVTMKTDSGDDAAFESAVVNENGEVVSKFTWQE